MRNICHKPHRYESWFNLLPENQGQTGRHKCAGCAFELGKQHAMLGIKKSKDDSVLANLPYSQAGSVRHRDAFSAYCAGYDFVMSMAQRMAA